MEAIVNKIEKSGLLTIDLADFLPKQEIIELDIKDFLWQGMILREKEFRVQIKEYDWSQFQDKNVVLYCSEDTIIANWAYMALAAALHGIAENIVFGDKEQMEIILVDALISEMDISKFNDKRVLVKGCGSIPIPTFSFVKIVNKLQPVVKSLMYGEACSSVPVYKQAKK